MQNAHKLYGRRDTKGAGINYLRNRIGRSVVALLAASAAFAATPGFAVPRLHSELPVSDAYL